MPFKSKSQARLLLSGKIPNFDKEKRLMWLKETPSLCCLPEKVGGEIPKKCRMQRKNEKIIGKIKKGPRGGKYFEIIEKDKNNIICKMKVYVNRKR